MATSENGQTIDSDLPSWLDKVTLNKAIEQQIGEFKKLTKFTIENDTRQGEIYSSLIIRIKADAEMEGEFKKLKKMIQSVILAFEKTKFCT